MIPEEAESVVQAIRKLVPRPKELPKSSTYGTLGWDGKWKKMCPLGMLPDANYAAPFYVESLQISACTAFWKWWDSQRDPQRAVDEVWGKE